MDTAPSLDVARSWLGRSEDCSDQITAAPVAALAATLGCAPLPAGEGEPLPPLWHWLYFLSPQPAGKLGPDGLVRAGSLLPPVRLPSVMWVGGRLAFDRPLQLGQRVDRHSVVTQITEKRGRSGPLVFVELQHEISDHDGLLMTETQDIVFRDSAPSQVDQGPGPGCADASDATDADWSKVIVPDSVMLFRYSALTFNSHRVHYDRAYATEVERHRGLLVQGPLIATLLAEAVRQYRPEKKMTAFSFRALQPLYEGQAIGVHGKATTGGSVIALWATNPAGGTAMSAIAKFEK